MGVQAHDDSLYFTGFGEEFVDLFFGCVEGEVSDVEGAGFAELVSVFFFRTLWEKHMVSS